MESIYDFSVNTLSGQPKALADYRGKLLLIVNVASRCGLTPQYEGLENLYKKYADRGLVVLGFPCNQFNGQEPGTPEDIKIFCEEKYHVTFPMFEKIEVNGAGEHPLYTFLKQRARGFLGSKAIKWNFTKFLVTPDGHVKKRFAPKDTPESFENVVIAHLP